jgi:hypothetical protein
LLQAETGHSTHSTLATSVGRVLADADDFVGDDFKAAHPERYPVT